MIDMTLKYGCNPHQDSARAQGAGLTVLSGTPGYINLLDALHAWQLVRELRQATGKPAAACFKHVSPAGAAVARPLDDEFRAAQFMPQEPLSPVATAYARARGGDRLCAFGDVAAVSDTVDTSLAELLRREVSDLIIAPGFDSAALDILRKKKNGNYVVLQADPDFDPPPTEQRQIFGLTLTQARNDAAITPQLFRTAGISEDEIESLLVATIALKYTQSNSIALAWQGQLIGVGAGQQSRVHCARLACDKADKWMLQHHPAVLGLPFRSDLSRIQRTNAIDQYLLLSQLSDREIEALHGCLKTPPQPLTEDQRRSFCIRFNGIVMSSDAFFPFRDSIDRASRSRVGVIAHPGGSTRDEEIAAAAREYDIRLIATGIRCFTH